MKEKVKCKKCGMMIDKDQKFCSFCGAPNPEYQEDSPSKKNSNQTPIVNNNIIEDQGPVIAQNGEGNSKKKKPGFFDFPSRELNVNIYKRITFLLMTLVFMSFFVLIFQAITQALGYNYFLSSVAGLAAINFSIYLLFFGIMLLILNSDVLDILKDFKRGRTWLMGFSYGFFVICVTSAVSTIMQLFYPSSVNSNEASIDSITSLYPFLSIIIFGIIGPFCEELAYRVGLFSIFKKINRVLAYVIVCVVFGLIHFNFSAGSTDELIVEFLNLPSYMVAGLLLSYIYEKEGVAASFIAHSTNNLVSILLQIILSSLI